MSVEIHTLVQDSHDLDHSRGTYAIEDKVRLNGELEVAGADSLCTSALEDAAGEAVEAIGQQSHVAVGLSIIPAFGRVGPYSGEVAASRGGKADAH